VIVEQTTHNDQTIIRYLLKELSAEDKARFEEAYLEDEGLFEQLQAMEDELIEDYLKGDIPAHEAQLFEQHYLASEYCRARVEVVRELVEVCSLRSITQAAANDTVDNKFFSVSLRLWMPAKRHIVLGIGVATALLLLIGSGLIIELSGLRRQLAAVNEERKALEKRAGEAELQLARERQQLTEERGHNTALRGKLESVNNRLSRLQQDLAKSQAPKDQVVFLVLAPGIRDVGKLDRAVISADTGFVELRVNLERRETANLRSYRVVVKIVEGGREIWVQEGIRPRLYRSAQYVVVRVPADRFTQAGGIDFMLTLGALTVGGKEYEEIENCYFKVISK
jgi:hypothetical protein